MIVTTIEPGNFREDCETCEGTIPVYGLAAVDSDGRYHCEDCAPVLKDRS